MSILDPQKRGDEGDAVARLKWTLGEDPFRAIEALRQAGRRKASAEALAQRMEHERKIMLARISSEIAEAHAKEGLSESKLDRMARSDPRYQTHIEGLAAAQEDRELAHSEYWAQRSHLEWLRAALAHENALSRLEG